MNERDRIEIDFARQMARAEELKEIADEMVALAEGDLSETLLRLAKGFGGENGAAFLKKGAALEPSLLQNAQKVMRISQNIRITAEMLYRAEKSAQTIF